MKHDAELRTILDQLGQAFALDLPDLAKAIGVPFQTLERWRSEDSSPQGDAHHRIAELVALDQRLQETFTDRDAIHSWLRTDNHFLSRIKPVEAIKVGRLDRFEAALEALDSGVFL